MAASLDYTYLFVVDVLAVKLVCSRLGPGILSVQTSGVGKPVRAEF